MTLKERREFAGLSRAQVGKVLEVHPAALCNWERGARRPLKKYRRKLAVLYNCTEEELMKNE